MSDLYEEGYEGGRRDALLQLAPLAEAIEDTIFMFKDIERARELPAYGNVVRQYIAMGKQLERLLALSGIKAHCPKE